MSRTLAEAMAWGRAQLAEKDIASAALDIRVLAACAAGIDPGRVIIQQEDVLTKEAEEKFKQLIGRRALGEPVAYLTGRREFWSLDLEVSPHVLIPRADSETLVQAALETVRIENNDLRVLDLGTGSGALLLALLSEWPSAIGLGVDKSLESLKIAQKNARRLGLEARCGFVAGDWASALQGRFDVVISNPPYIPDAELSGLARDVRGYEPHAALKGGEDGLRDLGCIVASAPRLLLPNGIVILECGVNQAERLCVLLEGQGELHVEGIRRDLAGHERCVVARMHAGVTG